MSEIILIEDSESDAEIVLRALKKANITNTITHLQDGEKAVEYFFAETGIARRSGTLPKLILLDLKMPKVDGLEIIKKLKTESHTKLIPIVILTSSKENKDIQEAYRLGVNSYVVKSADYDGFSKLVVSTVGYWLLINQAPLDT